MKLILSPNIRKIIKLCLKNNKKYNNNVKIRDIDGIGNLIFERKKDSYKDVRKYLNEEISLAYLGIKTLSILSLNIQRNEDKCQSIPQGWIDCWLIGNMIIQLTNYSLAALNLVEAGLESSAKSIVRSIYEISFLIIALLIDKERMNLYIQSLDRKEEVKLWRSHFAFKHLNNALTELEKELGFPEELRKDIENKRLSTYQYYSQSIHNSFISSIWGSYSVEPSNTDTLNCNLFGKHSLTVKEVIDDLNFATFYFISAITVVLKNYHNFKLPVDSDLWNLYYHMDNCYINAYVYVYYYNDITAEYEGTIEDFPFILRK